MAPGDHIISSYGYANRCFIYSKKTGGITFLDAGSSHPDNFWEIVSAEHKKWGCESAPMPKHWNRRGFRMLKHADFYYTPSRYVSNSLLNRGIAKKQLLEIIYPVDFAHWRPPAAPVPGPLHVIYSGEISFRKGVQYLIEVMSIVRKSEPQAKLTIVGGYANGLEGLINSESIPGLIHQPHSDANKLLSLYHDCHVHVQLSLEEGLVRTALIAMSSGLYSVVTTNTGANDFVEDGVNGYVVPIRDATKTAKRILDCWKLYQLCGPALNKGLSAQLSFDRFRKLFVAGLHTAGIRL